MLEHLKNKKITNLSYSFLDTEMEYPFFFRYPGSFKWYQAKSGSLHPDDRKEMVLIKAYCKKRDMNLEIQLPLEMNVECFFCKDWPE